jgi:hypothetical protein
VADLRKAIKQEKRPYFDHVPADTLDLWKVSAIPSNRRLKEEVEKLNLVLSPTDVLSDVFLAGVERKIVHIVVECPLPGERCLRS